MKIGNFFNKKFTKVAGWAIVNGIVTTAVSYFCTTTLFPRASQDFLSAWLLCGGSLLAMEAVTFAGGKLFGGFKNGHDVAKANKEKAELAKELKKAQDDLNKTVELVETNQIKIKNPLDPNGQKVFVSDLADKILDSQDKIDRLKDNGKSFAHSIINNINMNASIEYMSKKVDNQNQKTVNNGIVTKSNDAEVKQALIDNNKKLDEANDIYDEVLNMKNQINKDSINYIKSL